MHTGIVASFNDARGYGFVCSKDGDRIFAHRTDIKGGGYRTLVEAEPVEFDIAFDSSNRRRAIKISRIWAGSR